MNTLCFVDGCTYEYSFVFTSEYKLGPFRASIFAMFLFASTSQETCMRLCENLMNIGFAFCININLYLYKILYDVTDAMFLRRTVTSVCVISALGVVKPLYAVALSPSMRDGSAMPELAGKWRKPMTSFVTVQFSTAVSVSVYIAVLYTSVSLFFVFSSLLSTVPYREYKFLFLSLTVMKKASGPKSSIVRSTMTYTPAMRASVFCMFHTMYRPVSSMPWHFALISSLRSLFLSNRFVAVVSASWNVSIVLSLLYASIFPDVPLSFASSLCSVLLVSVTMMSYVPTYTTLTYGTELDGLVTALPLTASVVLPAGYRNVFVASSSSVPLTPKSTCVHDIPVLRDSPMYTAVMLATGYASTQED